MKKIILDLCGGTGAWSRFYKENGYDVRLATLPDTNILKWRDYPEIAEPVEAGEVYGILAAPPCTEFSIAKGNRSRDLRTGMKVVQACLDIIWIARIHGKLKFWAIENPTGLLRQFLGNPAFTFQPWNFGDFHSKSTDLWGYFNKPKIKYADRPLFPPIVGHGGQQQYMNTPIAPKEYRNLKLNRAAIRAITPPGFALAFFKANK